MSKKENYKTKKRFHKYIRSTKKTKENVRPLFAEILLIIISDLAIFKQM